ncbi:hypothetical protein AMTR_s00004p00238920 [Amborella trichopoda]|uniref:Uncharacterized protein n=1 Tax=Amborella trichopoda TaxID=13333 RepID=W1NE94_AMBTC|nr:hypothetical protein AMTR_s00004p00238920 [Amborella trichopoda]
MESSFSSNHDKGMIDSLRGIPASPRRDEGSFFGNSTTEDPKGTLRFELAEKDELRGIKGKVPLVDDDSMIVTTIHKEGSSSVPYKESFSLVEVHVNIEVALKVLFLGILFAQVSDEAPRPTIAILDNEVSFDVNTNLLPIAPLLATASILGLDQVEGAPLSTEADIPPSSPLKLNEAEVPEVQVIDLEVDEVEAPPLPLV